MRILIDLTDLEQWQGNHGGIQRVVYGISKEFYLDPSDLQLEFMRFSKEDKEFYPSSFEPIYNRVENKSGQRKIGRLKNKIVSKVRSGLKAGRAATPAGPIRFDKDDTVLILGKPWDDLDIQRTLAAQKEQAGFKLVQVVYDLIICLQPQLQNPVLYDSYREHMTGAVRSSDLMLAISESTAKDLRQFCKQENLKEPKIKVIRLGDEISGNQQKAAVKPDSRIAKDFIACVGTVEIRKNHNLLYYTYKLAEERRVRLPQLVIVGGQGWLTGDTQHLINTDPALKGKVLMLHDVDDKGLDWVYRNCLFTIYPSMYEGWGLPVAESLVYGKMCVSSNASSMPEIAGDLIDYFNPYSADECLAKIVEYTDGKTRAVKEKEIKDRYGPTSWRQTFEQTLSYLRKL